MPTIRISTGVHTALKDKAQEENRSVSNMAETVLMSFLDGTPTKTPPSPKNTNVKILENGTVTKADPDNPEFEYHTDAPVDLTDILKDPKKSEATPRTRGDILAEIRQLESERDEKMRYCQDEELRQQIFNTHKQLIDPLWVQYKEVE